MSADFEICFQSFQFGVTFLDVIDDLLLKKIHIELLVQNNTQVFEVVCFNDRGACCLSGKWTIYVLVVSPFQCKVLVRRARWLGGGVGGKNVYESAEGRRVDFVFVYWHLILVTPDGLRVRSTFLPRLPLAMVVLF